jgi:hypothetical protein
VLGGGRADDPEDHSAHGTEYAAQDNGLHQTQSLWDRVAK